MPRATRIFFAGLAFLVAGATAGCAHRQPDLVRVDSDWIRPRVDEAARAALRCLRREPDRLVEIDAGTDGTSRAWVHPYPAAPALQACADEEAARLHIPPSVSPLRSIVDGGGQLVDPSSPRVRALSLRSRAIDQSAAVTACRSEFLTRTPGKTGRAQIALSVDDRGSVSGAEVSASTLDESATACVRAAARALVLPAAATVGPTTYRYSYLFTTAGVLVTAPDLDPVDRYDLGVALATIAPRTDECIKRYRGKGRLFVHYTVGNDGAAVRVVVERATTGLRSIDGRDEDVDADRCLEREGRRLRVLPFDGPPAQLTVPYTLR